ncbi:MAG: hypothetical protein ACI31F_03155 [Muribaculaceae bacterium]
MQSKKYTNNFITSGSAKENCRSEYYKLLQKVRKGEYILIKRGVYASEEQLADTMIDVEAVVPNGVLCLYSAWNIYGLTTTLPQAYHIAVQRGRKIKLPCFPKIKLHHTTNAMFDIGIELRNINGYQVRIYNIERCVCDAVKFRNKIGLDVCVEIVKNYLSGKGRNISLLLDYATKLRVKKILEQYISILI